MRMWLPRSGKRVNVAPYDWRAGSPHTGRTAQPGDLVVWTGQRRPLRVVEVREIPTDLWGEKYEQGWAEVPNRDVAREAWMYRPVSLVVEALGGSRDPDHFRCRANAELYLLPEHYAVCAVCGEVPPCHAEDLRHEADIDASEAQRVMAIAPYHCLSCGEYVSRQQGSVRYPGPNLWRFDLPDGSAIFHTRRDCAGHRDRYDRAFRRQPEPVAEPTIGKGVLW